MMSERLSLTVPFFATEKESNIVNNINDGVFPTPMDQPPPSLVVQEEARPNQETDQLVCSTPHRPHWRMEDGEMVGVALVPSPLTTPHCTQHMLPLTPMTERMRVLLEAILPRPMQATMHNRLCADLLVCPPLPRNGRAVMWLHQEEMVCGRVLASPLSYEERSEVVCVGWGRMARSLPHQTSNTTEPSSGVENNLGATGTHGHTTHHYTPQLLQLLTEMTTLNTPVCFNANAYFSCECHSDEEGEYRPKNGIPREAVGDPPTTQQLVSGRTT